MLKRSVLTYKEMGILQVSLEIAADKFKENAEVLRKTPAVAQLAETFDEQEKTARVLLSLVTTADRITIEEEG